MKRIASILLLLIITLPFAGTYTWLQIEKAIVKKSVKQIVIQGLSDDQLVKFEFLKNEIDSKVRWHHKNEFEFKGDMYDILRRIESEQLVTLWCFKDEEETKLKQKIAALLENELNQDEQRKEKKEKTLHFYKNLFCKAGFIFESGQYLLTKKYCITNSKQNTTYLFSPPSPPPRLG
ncbi:MAG: hypothetical protein WC341_11140 [Bacteroidales bacterium]